jgi:hypothetical protein
LGLFVLISLAFIVMGFAYKTGVLAFFGSIVLMVLSWTLVGCSALLGYVLGLVSLFMVIYSVVGIPLMRK